MECIDSFSGIYRFLSNFWVCEVEYDGITYPSSEHAYVAAKTDSEQARKHIATINTAGQVKRFGRTLELREDWEEVKFDEMRKILRSKFKPGSELASMLIDTGDTILIEGNTWGDTIWGQCPIGNGQNMLGKILMEIRSELV